MRSNACGCSVPVYIECGNSRCDSVSTSCEPTFLVRIWRISTSTTAMKR